MKPRSIIFACTLFVAAAARMSSSEPQVANQAPSTQLAADIAAYAHEELERTGLASIQIAIAHEGAVVFSQAYGKADIELDVEASPETRYRTASISKWFTATAAMGLVGAGMLDLDAPIQIYCPEFPEKRGTITTRHLLGHTSGIRHYRNYKQDYDAAESDEERRSVEFDYLEDRHSRVRRYTDVIAPLTVFSDEPLVFEPGAAYRYTSFGYRVLGCVIQGAAGKPYVEVLRDRLFSPIGMADTVEDDAWAIIPNRASGYDVEDEGALRRTDMRDVSENLPAGGHLSTATDLVLFAQAYAGGELISAAAQAQMLAGSVDKNGNRFDEVYGLGVRTFDFGSDPLIGHDGSQAGASTILFHAPTTNISIAILSNTRGLGWTSKMDAFSGKVYEAARHELAPS